MKGGTKQTQYRNSIHASECNLLIQGEFAISHIQSHPQDQYTLLRTCSHGLRHDKDRRVVSA